MMDKLNSSMPADYAGKGGGDTYATAASGALLLYDRFFNSSPSMMMQIVVRESHHHVFRNPDWRLRMEDEYVGKYGYPAMVRQAELSGPRRMMLQPDAVTFAFGFERDDD